LSIATNCVCGKTGYVAKIIDRGPPANKLVRQNAHICDGISLCQKHVREYESCHNSKVSASHARHFTIGSQVIK